MNKLIPINKLIEYRRYLHKYPEIGFNTRNTKDYIISKINEIDYDSKKIKLDILEVSDSLIITLSTKKSTILGFRTDIDGLEITEENDCSYKSTNNYMHACGHDAHSAILLYLIVDILNNPTHLNGTIRFICQTAEEGPDNGGAYYLYNHPLIQEIDYFYALHVNSELDSNTIYYKEDYIMASSTTFRIELFGTSSHITRSNEGIDVLKKGILIYNEINNITIKDSLIYIGKFNCGTSTNIVPSHLIIEGSIRTFDENILELIKSNIYNIVLKYCSNCKFNIEYNSGYPSLNNNIESLNLLIECCNLINCNIYKLDKAFYLSDDFSRFSKHNKICYFFLGTKKDKSVPLHSSAFDINEESLILGYHIYKKIISEYFRRLKGI